MDEQLYDLCDLLEYSRYQSPSCVWKLYFWNHKSDLTVDNESRNELDWAFHDDVIKWKHFSRYWPFVRGIRRSPVDSPHKGQWRGAWIFSLICRLSKQSISRWFETPSRSLWRHCHAECTLHAMSYARCLRFVVFSCGQASTQYTHSLQGYFTGTGKIVLWWLPEHQRSKSKG